MVADAVCAGPAVGPEIDVAACDCFAFGRASDGHRVAIYVADVDVICAGGAPFDFAVCRVERLADVDTSGPAGGVYDCCCGAERGFLWSAKGAWGAGVV